MSGKLIQGPWQIEAPEPAPRGIDLSGIRLRLVGVTAILLACGGLGRTLVGDSHAWLWTTAALVVLVFGMIRLWPPLERKKAGSGSADSPPEQDSMTKRPISSGKWPRRSWPSIHTRPTA